MVALEVLDETSLMRPSHDTTRRGYHWLYESVLQGLWGQDKP